MTAESLIELLKSRGMISEKLAEQLRSRAEQGGPLASPDGILDLLASKNVLLPGQIAEIRHAEPSLSSDLELLEIAPLEEAPAEEQEDVSESGWTRLEGQGISEPSDDDEILELEPLSEDEAFGDPTESNVLHEGPAARRPVREPEPEPEGDGYVPPGVAGAGGLVFPGATSKADSLAHDPSLAMPTFVTLKATGKKKKKGEKAAAGRDDEKDKDKSGKSRRRHAWDSPLVLYGGGSLALLCGVGALLWFLLFREGADAVMKKAEDYFKTGQYTQAQAEYQIFVDKFSSHPDYSLAKVRLGLTQLWAAVEGTSNYTNAVAVAERIIPQIEDEPAFVADGSQEGSEGEGLSQAKQDLSALLTRIAEGLAEQAEAATDDAQALDAIEKFKAVVALTENTKYVPKRYRLDEKLSLAAATVDRVELRRVRGAALAATLAEMDKAIAAGDVTAAFAARKKLLADNPVLESDEQLAKKVREASAAEQKIVKFVPDQKAAVTTPAPSPVIAELVLADRRLPAPAAADSPPAVVFIDGALFGLRSGDGSLLWRRRIGETAPSPLHVGKDLVAVAAGGELLRLGGETGKLVWRLPLDDELTSPVVAGKHLVTAGKSGKVYVVDEATGNLVGFVQLSQPIHVAPAVNERGDRIFVVGEQSSLYTLTTDDFSCLAVFYLGHLPGAIEVPPLVSGNKLVVAENVGTETAVLRVLQLDERSAATSQAAEARLVGLVTTPLSGEGRRFAAATTSGFVTVYELSGAGTSAGLSNVAKREPREAKELARFALLREGQLWLAGDELANLEVLPTENQMVVRSLDRDFRGDAFDGPLQAVGNLVISLRRPAGRAGAVVAATDPAAARTVWETELAVPLAGAPAIDAAELRVGAVSATGAGFVIDRAAMTRRLLDRAARTPEGTGATSLDSSIDLGRGQVAASGIDAESILVLDAPGANDPLSAIPIAGPLACPLVAWRGGVAVATKAGQISLVDPATGKEIAAPFQPPLVPGRKYLWRQPTVVGEGDAARLAVSDGADKVYLLDVEQSPEPHLVAAASADVGKSPLASPLAATGSKVFAGNEAGQLAFYATTDLAHAEPINLGARIAWGPHAVGDGVLLATDGGELILVGDDGAIRWRRREERGSLGGTPLVTDGAATLLHTSGGLSEINLSDGKEAWFAELGQPVMAGPVALGPRLIVAAPDGTLLVVNRPQGNPPQ